MSNNEGMHDLDDGFFGHSERNIPTGNEIHHSPEIPGFKRTEGSSTDGAATVVFESLGSIRSVYGEMDFDNY